MTAPDAKGDLKDVAVVATGSANLASMLAALRRAGAAPRVVHSPDEVRDHPRLVVPGVGTFAAAVAQLQADGLWEALRLRLQQTTAAPAGDPRATLLVCLGLQLLCEASDESPGVVGLGLLPGAARRFPTRPGLRVPQLGWSAVVADPGCRLLHSGAAYFANSYAAPPTSLPPGFLAARAHHGAPYLAAVEHGRVLACQFHPELSGAFGLSLLRRWLHDAPPDLVFAGPGVRVIPCLDVADGRVVKGVRFAGLRDAGDPAARAALYESQGADELVILDVSATPQGRRTQAETVAAVRARIGIPLTVGGGVRGVDDAKRLLDAGADKVAVNTAAVADPALLTALAERFGRQCTVLSLDARRAPDGYRTVTHSGGRDAGRDAVAWAREAADRGAGEILLTSFDQDGTRAGYDLDLLAAVRAAVSVPIIASGGAAGVEHLHQAITAGADAVLAASIFHDGDMSVAEVKHGLAMRGVRVRT